jgi:hypothetical protein
VLELTRIALRAPYTEIAVTPSPVLRRKPAVRADEAAPAYILVEIDDETGCTSEEMDYDLWRARNRPAAGAAPTMLTRAS